MSQRIKLGEVYVEIPDGISPAIAPHPGLQPIRAEKPETPEPLEEPQYIYRPNDPFQAQIDEARAIASISSLQKPWVRKTWFVIFVIGPLLYAELAALAAALRNPGADAWRLFLAWNALILPVWAVFYSIWRRKVKPAKSPKSG